MKPTNQEDEQREATPQGLEGGEKLIQIDEGKIQANLGEMVRSTLEETLNAILEAESDRLGQAKRYERTEARQDTRAGCYRRELPTPIGQVRC